MEWSNALAALYRAMKNTAKVENRRHYTWCVSALVTSFAVMSTIGMTRSYAMRVGPITPSVPTIRPSTL
jgi:hypothetical protein